MRKITYRIFRLASYVVATNIKKFGWKQVHKYKLAVSFLIIVSQTSKFKNSYLLYK